MSNNQPELISLAKSPAIPVTIHTLLKIDEMDGHIFEYWCADLLKYNGFSNIVVTPGSGDQGVDILARKNNEDYAIQCKRYSKSLSNKPIQEVYSGRKFYSCSRAAVITNQSFTPSAVELANRLGVFLWDRDSLVKMLEHRNQLLNNQLE